MRRSQVDDRKRPSCKHRKKSQIMSFMPDEKFERHTRRALFVFFECETFETLRQTYFEIWYAKKNNVLSIAKYLVDAFDMRNEINN